MILVATQMRNLNETDADVLHEIMQPLNIIRLSCSNVRGRLSTLSDDDAEYIIRKILRIEEQTVRAAELLQHLKSRSEDSGTRGVL